MSGPVQAPPVWRCDCCGGDNFRPGENVRPLCDACEAAGCQRVGFGDLERGAACPANGPRVAEPPARPGIVVDVDTLHVVTARAVLPTACPGCGADTTKAVQEEAWGCATSTAHVEGAYIVEDSAHVEYTADGVIRYRCDGCNAVLVEGGIVDAPKADAPTERSSTDAGIFTRRLLRVLQVDRVPATLAGPQLLEVVAGDLVHTITVTTRRRGAA